MKTLQYTTPHGIAVTRALTRMPYKKGLGALLRELDIARGIYLSSGYEYPERYARWDIASLRPPLEIVGRGRVIEFRPLNARGEMIAEMFAKVLAAHPHWER